MMQQYCCHDSSKCGCCHSMFSLPSSLFFARFAVAKIAAAAAAAAAAVAAIDFQCILLLLTNLLIPISVVMAASSTPRTLNFEL